MRTARQNEPMSDSEMVKFLAGGKQTLPMELAEGNCHAESVAGSKGSSARATAGVSQYHPLLFLPI